MPNLSWVAYYSNGRRIHEGQEQIVYCSLPRESLERFELVDERGIVKGSMKLEDGEKVFYRRRTFAPCTPRTDYVYLLGCRKRNTEGIIQIRLLIIKSDGSTIIDNQFRSFWFEPSPWGLKEQV